VMSSLSYVAMVMVLAPCASLRYGSIIRTWRTDTQEKYSRQANKKHMAIHPRRFGRA